MIWHPELSIILTKDIGEGCTIHAPVWIGRDVKIGKNVKIQAFAFIPDGVTIKDNCFIGPHTCFGNDLHPPSGKKNHIKTLVKKGASVGMNATIIPGVTIGEGAMVGGGAVVVDDVESDITVVGNPAHKINEK